MAKKDNTLMWVAGAGIAYYLYTQYKNGTLAIPGLTPATNTAPGASTGTLALPPAVAQLNAAASNAPNTNAVNITNLVPAAVSPSGIPVIAPGQSLALNANSTPVTNSAGVPMLFTTSVLKPNYSSLAGGPEYGGGECL